jgi:hypothetical protein|tara:strand:+ start:133 stop:408 length:276 start_codon:yes stop_codon:yes gene_type:complete
VVGKVYENHVKWLARVAVGPGDQVDLVYTAVAITVWTEEFAEDCLNIVRVKLVVNPGKAHRRNSDNVIGSHDYVLRMRVEDILEVVLKPSI